MHVQPMLFDAADVPEMAVPVAEHSQEWRDAQLLQLVEGVRFDPQRLAAYVAGAPDGCEFLDYVIERLGGRSQ
ncbi:MAG TPA: hypothetical protein VNW90_15690 [Acetobacteraceae bacterium]|jgi:hypothetical protein|nr:hypothetical protein [Acetobacteraceae bacterium]